MAPTSYGPERRTVEYASVPTSHLWVALSLGIGGTVFVLGAFLGFGEVLFSLKKVVLEAIFLAG